MTLRTAVFTLLLVLMQFNLPAQTTDLNPSSGPSLDSSRFSELIGETLSLCMETVAGGRSCTVISENVEMEFGFRDTHVIYRLTGSEEYRIYDVEMHSDSSLWPGEERIISIVPHPTDENRYAVIFAEHDTLGLAIFDAGNRRTELVRKSDIELTTGFWNLEDDEFVFALSDGERWNRVLGSSPIRDEPRMGTPTVPIGVPIPQPNLRSAGYALPLNTFHKNGADSDLQCTRYAWGRVYERTGIKLEIDHSTGERHGGRWLGLIRNAATGNEVRALAVAVFEVAGSRFGHVGFVEHLENGRVLMSDGNMDGDGKFSGFRWLTLTELKNHGNMRLLGFIYPGESPATLSNPVPNSQLTATSMELRWSVSRFARGVNILIGPSPGSSQYFGFSTSAARSVRVTGLPSDGRNLHIRLQTRFDGSVQQKDYAVRAVDLVPAYPGVLISPASGSRLTGNSATFSWQGTRVSEYALSVGDFPGNGNYFGSSVGTATSQTVLSLPTDGRTIYVSLRSRIGNTWTTSNYTVTAANLATAARVVALITTPLPGSSLLGSLQQFNWTAGSGALEYSIRVGSTTGGAQYYSRFTGLATSATVGGVPSGGKTLHVRLGTRFSTGWTFRDYVYRSR